MTCENLYMAEQVFIKQLLVLKNALNVETILFRWTHDFATEILQLGSLCK